MKTKLKERSKVQRLLAVLLTMAMALGIGVFYVSAEGEPTVDTTLMHAGETYNGDCDIAFEVAGNTLLFYVNGFSTQATATPYDCESVNGFCDLDAYKWVFNDYFSKWGKVFFNGEEIEKNTSLKKTNADTVESVCYNCYVDNKYPDFSSGSMKWIASQVFIINLDEEITDDFFDKNEIVLKRFNGIGEEQDSITVGTYVEPTATMELVSSLGDSLDKEDITTLTVNNGQDGFQYEFKVHNDDTDAWWTIQKLSEKNYCEWYAGPAAAKNGKTVYAYVKDADGNDVETLQLPVTVNEKESNLTLNNFKIIPENGLTASTNATLSVDADGGTAPYQYRFRVNKNGTDTWYTIKGFDENNSCTWWAGPAAGAKTIYVDVKDANGDTFMMVIPVNVGEPAMTVDVTSSMENLKASDTTTLTANVTGAEGDFTCSFKIYNKKTEKTWWVPASDIDGNTCKWYAGPEAADKVITVYVKDSAGNTANGTLEVNVA